MTRFSDFIRSITIATIAATAMVTAPVAAQQVETIDPDAVFAGGIDADLAPQPSGASTVTQTEPDEEYVTYSPAPEESAGVAGWEESDVSTASVESGQAIDAPPAAVEASKTTYGEDDLIGAAEGVFGKGAEGLARMVEKLLKEQGEPNAYIVGREAGGAFVVGARYGSGTLHHKVEGERKVYWTGPSVGFDVGANASNTFVLVYNLYDSEELYERYPAGEGQAYVVGGLTASYLRKGDVVLIPIRMGAGLRLGINAGYMKFSKKQRWLPF